MPDTMIDIFLGLAMATSLILVGFLAESGGNKAKWLSFLGFLLLLINIVIHGPVDGFYMYTPTGFGTGMGVLLYSTAAFLKKKPPFFYAALGIISLFYFFIVQISPFASQSLHAMNFAIVMLCVFVEDHYRRNSTNETTTNETVQICKINQR